MKRIDEGLLLRIENGGVTTDDLPRLLAERTTLLAIVRDLMDGQIVAYGEQCLFCFGMLTDPTFPLTQHETNCPFRRAVEYLDELPTPDAKETK